jgi:hypothetical protein
MLGPAYERNICFQVSSGLFGDVGWEMISGFSLSHFPDWGIEIGALARDMHRERVQEEQKTPL